MLDTSPPGDIQQIRSGRSGVIARRLADLELPILLVCLPLFLIPTTWVWLGVSVVVVLWACRYLAYGRLTRPAPPNVLYLGLVLLIPLSLWITLTPPETRQQAAYLFAGVALYFAILNWTWNKARLWWLCMGLLTLLFLLLLVSPLLVEENGATVLAWLPDGVLQLARRLPERINPNVLAGNLAPLLPLCLALAWLPFGKGPQQRRWLRILAILTAALLVIVLVLLNSRGVWLALVLTGGVMAIVRWPRLVRTLPLVVVLAALALSSQFYERLVSTTLATGELGGFGTRVEIWSRAFLAIQDFALTGVGMGAWAKIAPLMYPYANISFQTSVPHAHNLLLQVGVDLGIPGLVLFSAAMGLSLWMAWRVFRRFHAVGSDHVAQSRAYLAFAVLAGFVLILAHGLFDAVTWGTKPAILAWALLALAAVLYLLPDETQEIAASP